ncbi:MAG: zinc metalloprotease HtpX [Chloroflexota bacterium]|nr:MAG: zinc metalloprotease HtpX [Chloroflexota bacterium]
MQRQWYGRDPGLTARMFFAMFLLAVVYLGFLAVLWYAGAGYGAMVVIAGLMIGAQYFLSDRLVLWSMGAHEVSPEQAPKLHAQIERLAALVNLPKPRVAIADQAIPNAFATGRGPKSSVVAVTTGLLNRLEGPELEAVLAHEITHIKNRDVVVITLASFFSTVAFFILRWSMFFGGGDRRRNAQGIIFVYLASLATWLISFLLIRALSRYREYAADRGSAIITGAPSQLASALMKIAGTMQRIPQRDLREVEGMNAFFIVPAISGESVFELLSTHPSLERRLQRLERMQQQMEGL